VRAGPMQKRNRGIKGKACASSICEPLELPITTSWKYERHTKDCASRVVRAGTRTLHR